MIKKLKAHFSETAIKNINGIHYNMTRPSLKVPQTVSKVVTKKDKEEKIIFLDEIKDMITGYARIVKYVNHSVSKHIDQDNMMDSGKRLIKLEN